MPSTSSLRASGTPRLAAANALHVGIGARFLVLPGVGHTPTWDDPPLIAELLLEASAAEPAAATV